MTLHGKMELSMGDWGHLGGKKAKFWPLPSPMDVDFPWYSVGPMSRGRDHGSWVRPQLQMHLGGWENGAEKLGL